MTTKSSSRPYRKKKRARQEEETRRRITEAAVAPAGGGDGRLRAALRLVVDFGTWRLLTGSGLTGDAAAALAAGMTGAEFGSAPNHPGGEVTPWAEEVGVGS